MRGPKSRAGFQPACVSGANRLMSAATVKPMKKGARCLVGRAALWRSTRENIMSTRTAVPKASTTRAFAGEIRERAASSVPNTAGFGKYSPNTIADSWLPGSPLTSPWTASNSVMKEPNSHSMVNPPRTPPTTWDIQ